MKLAVVSRSHRWKITSAGRLYEIIGLLLILLSSVHVCVHTIKTTVRPAYYEHYTTECPIRSQYVFYTFPNTPRSNRREKINHDRPVRQEWEQSVFVILGIDGVLWLVLDNMYVIRGHGVFILKSWCVHHKIALEMCKWLFIVQVNVRVLLRSFRNLLLIGHHNREL